MRIMIRVSEQINGSEYSCEKYLTNEELEQYVGEPLQFLWDRFEEARRPVLKRLEESNVIATAELLSGMKRKEK